MIDRIVPRAEMKSTLSVVLAHLTGFAMGALAGVAHAAIRVPRGPTAQWVSGLLAIGALVLAWALALSGA